MTNTHDDTKHNLCSAIEPLLSSYLFDELTPEEKSKVALHLETCEACREELAQLKAAAEIVAASPAKGDALAGVDRRAILENARTPRKAPIRRFAPFLAAVAALLVIGVMLGWGPAGRRGGLFGPVADGTFEIKYHNGEGSTEKKLAELHRKEEAPAPIAREPAATTAPVAPAAPAGGAELEVARGLQTLSAPPSETGASVDSLAALPAPGQDAFARQASKPSSLGFEALHKSPADATAVSEAKPLVAGAVPANRGEQERQLSLGSGQGAGGATRQAGRSRSYDAGAPGGEARRSLEALRDKPGNENGKALQEQELSGDKDVETLAKLRERVQPLSAPQAGGAVVDAKSNRTSLKRSGGITAAKATSAPLGPVATAGLAPEGIPPAGAGGIPDPKGKNDRYGFFREGDGEVPAGLASGQGAGLGRGLGEESKEASARGGREKATGAGIEAAPNPADWKKRVDDFLTRLDRRPGETPADMFFRHFESNDFVELPQGQFSTFGMDVDSASYTIYRSYLYKTGTLPPKEAIRTEAFANYFPARTPPPADTGPSGGKPFSISSEIAPSPFAREASYRLLRIAIKAREVKREKRKAASLTFVVDTSGSMREENRIELVRESLRLLVKELDEGDTIGIVAFDTDARTMLEPISASEREKVLDAIGRLEPFHNTNVDAGLRLGYSMAARSFRAGVTNRVILLSDGVANTGVTDPKAMLENIRPDREKGIYLTCVGVGMKNHNNSTLEELADHGDGRCVYVDRLEEAKKVFVDELTGTLEVIARDAKVQVEFDPAAVIRYRLLGYEKRALAASDFRNDKVDAGEVGAGHEVLALYELKTKDGAAGKIGVVRVRSKTPEHGEAQELEQEISLAGAPSSFAEASPRFQLNACAAAAAEVLRESYWARSISLEKIIPVLESAMPRLSDDPDAIEFLALLKKADPLVRERQKQSDQVAQMVDAYKENVYLRAKLEDQLQARTDLDRQRALDELRRQNEDLRRRLTDLLAR